MITKVGTLDELMRRSVADRRLNAWLFGAFGVIGLVLAATGIASVVSYSVARRTREMGLRLALGARPAEITGLVIRESLAPVLGGLALGIATALGLSRFVASLLYGVQPRDLGTYATVCLILVASAVAAAYVPARRAGRVDPMVSLRVD